MNPAFLFLGIGFLFLKGKSAMAGDATEMPESPSNSEGKQKFGAAWNRYDALFQKASNDYGVPFEWLKGIAIIESSLGTDPYVISGGVSRDGKSWGLMQFTLPTARDYDSSTTPEKLNSASFSIDLAGQYLEHLSNEFNGDARKVIMSYNQGEGNTKAGKTLASGYYTKYLAALTLINGG